jgi:hypothetical protein
MKWSDVVWSDLKYQVIRRAFFLLRFVLLFQMNHSQFSSLQGHRSNPWIWGRSCMTCLAGLGQPGCRPGKHGFSPWPWAETCYDPVTNMLEFKSVMSVNWHDNPRTTWPEDMIHQENCVKMYRIYRTCFIETCNMSGSFSILFQEPWATLSYQQLSPCWAWLYHSQERTGSVHVSIAWAPSSVPVVTNHDIVIVIVAAWFNLHHIIHISSYNNIICLLFFHGCMYIYILYIFIYMLYILPTTTHVPDIFLRHLQRCTAAAWWCRPGSPVMKRQSCDKLT